MHGGRPTCPRGLPPAAAISLHSPPSHYRRRHPTEEDSRPPRAATDRATRVAPHMGSVQSDRVRTDPHQPQRSLGVVPPAIDGNRAAPSFVVSHYRITPIDSTTAHVASAWIGRSPTCSHSFAAGYRSGDVRIAGSVGPAWDGVIARVSMCAVEKPGIGDRGWATTRGPRLAFAFPGVAGERRRGCLWSKSDHRAATRSAPETAAPRLERQRRWPQSGRTKSDPGGLASPGLTADVLAAVAARVGG
jgi:hypothetical protein